MSSSPGAAPAPIYLDHNATTRPDPRVIEATREAMETLWANPSSVHRAGQHVRHRVELARESVAHLIGARSEEIVFTGSGTESTNLAIFGTAWRQRRGAAAGATERDVLVTTTVEHAAVREPVEALEKQGFTIVRLSVDREGLLDPDALGRALAAHAGRVALVSILWANNETGAIQTMAELLRVTRAADERITFHTDAVQWVGKMPTDLRDGPPVDLLSFAAHKFHGPKGIGALYARKGVRLKTLIHGGPHERQRRGGTEDAPAIVGLGVAAEIAMRRLATRSAEGPSCPLAPGGAGGSNRVHSRTPSDVNDDDAAPQPSRGLSETPPLLHDDAARVAALRDEFERRILETVPDAIVNGPADPAKRMWNTTNIAFDRLEAEAILLLLSERGVYASAGAACSSGSLDPSPILLAMGIEPRLAHGSIRFSLSYETTREEIERAAEIVRAVIERLRRVLPA